MLEQERALAPMNAEPTHDVRPPRNECTEIPKLERLAHTLVEHSHK